MDNKRVVFVVIFSLVFVLIMSACNKSPDDQTTIPTLSLDDFEEQFFEFGAIIDSKPDFAAVGAKNARAFKFNGQRVIVYEFESEDAVEASRTNYSQLVEMPKNERFLLDSSNDTIIYLFNTIEPGVMIKNAPFDLSVPGDIVVGSCEISLISAGFLDEVLPQNEAAENSKKFEKSDGYVYIDISTEIKNTDSSLVAADTIMNVSMTYGGKDYTASAVVDKEGVGFANSAMTMIDFDETVKLHYIIKCPSTIKDAEGEKIVTLTTYAKNYTIKLS